MIELSTVIGFDWDEGNARKSTDKHSVIQSEAEQIFFNQPLLLLDDLAQSLKEARYHALGITDDGRLLHVTFTLRTKGTLIRVISSRGLHRKEKTIYEQSQE